ncbi:hypothetical protein [Halostagnicola kamekurae]|uniref:Uncharacterized protein n=1 Tax=Halostagnicola kamekurae TaxID=619731 RepID=A0A1I6UTQ7_9EURY|nr:hypothetical protein [Halostagnicola kamekurae]SFT04848.1 hypothetical protein SAMN04488556_4095 [Halostagnicola kamekurae]
MGLSDYLPDTPLEQTDNEDYEAVDKELTTSLVQKMLPTMDYMAVERKVQVIETVRWYLAFDSAYNTQTRRTEAQERVADSHEVTVPAVQAKVRKVYENRYGRKNAQKLFDEDLEQIEEAYMCRVEDC